MSQKSLLLGFVLMAISLPLYATIPRSATVAEYVPVAAGVVRNSNKPVSQTVQSPADDGQDFSILDTRPGFDSRLKDHRILSDPAPLKLTAHVTPVPEPMHYALIGLGFVGLYLARRDRRSTK